MVSQITHDAPLHQAPGRLAFICVKTKTALNPSALITEERPELRLELLLHLNKFPVHTRRRDHMKVLP